MFCRGGEIRVQKFTLRIDLVEQREISQTVRTHITTKVLPCNGRTKQKTLKSQL